MRILHTADWHIGKKLYGRNRYEEHEQFFAWMIETIKEEKVEALIMAGDVFDTTAPSNRAQELYYNTLISASSAGCRQIVIIGGNHDSPSLLNAPKELCSALNIHVIGCATGPDFEKEVITLCNEEGEMEIIVCAVPYLRDRDLRTVVPGETDDEKNRKYISAITEHYEQVGKIASNLRAGTNMPIIGMGHLYTAEGQAGDGVRDLYVGNMAHLKATAFPACYDYLAFGHLHVPQMVAGQDHIRYSGSPIPMGFGEAGQQKQVVIVDFDGRKPIVSTRDIPEFQALERVEGDFDRIVEVLNHIAKTSPTAWVQIEYTGEPFEGNLRREFEDIVAPTGLEIRRVINSTSYQQTLSNYETVETLESMDQSEVFTRCLDSYEIPDKDRPSLLAAYHEVLLKVREEDANAA
ncbi:MAG: exonuclease SbcCD subunit D C-terminal domain-containing protein [Verrucomicrobiales bacterium]|nr:exonuclease SbcCD subunit D C-terminal domain-containing protein [Verrucomicrobiales bacterium]